MCCESHNLCFTTIGPEEGGLRPLRPFFRETRNAVRTVRTVRYSYPRVMLPQLPPWTGGCHIMPTHAGKGSTPRGLLSDLLVRVQHPASLSRPANCNSVWRYRIRSCNSSLPSNWHVDGGHGVNTPCPTVEAVREGLVQLKEGHSQINNASLCTRELQFGLEDGTASVHASVPCLQTGMWMVVMGWIPPAQLWRQ